MRDNITNYLTVFECHHFKKPSTTKKKTKRKKKKKEFDIITYVLFAGWEVRMVKNCDRGLETAFSRPRSQFFTIRIDP